MEGVCPRKQSGTTPRRGATSIEGIHGDRQCRPRPMRRMLATAMVWERAARLPTLWKSGRSPRVMASGGRQILPETWWNGTSTGMETTSCPVQIVPMLTGARGGLPGAGAGSSIFRSSTLPTARVFRRAIQAQATGFGVREPREAPRQETGVFCKNAGLLSLTHHGVPRVPPRPPGAKSAGPTRDAKQAPLHVVGVSHHASQKIRAGPGSP